MIHSRISSSSDGLILLLRTRARNRHTTQNYSFIFIKYVHVHTVWSSQTEEKNRTRTDSPPGPRSAEVPPLSHTSCLIPSVLIPPVSCLRDGIPRCTTGVCTFPDHLHAMDLLLFFCPLLRYDDSACDDTEPPGETGAFWILFLRSRAREIDIKLQPDQQQEKHDVQNNAALPPADCRGRM